jgi:hypothetical protein
MPARLAPSRPRIAPHEKLVSGSFVLEYFPAQTKFVDRKIGYDYIPLGEVNGRDEAVHRPIALRRGLTIAIARQSAKCPFIEC